MPELHPLPTYRFPQLILADALESTLPLEHTRVTAQISGPIASVVVTQRFGNPLQEPAELEYLFPLAENAAVTGFELRVGARRIVGEVQEQTVARAAYEEARGQGKRTGLFEQRRPNLFAVRLANVLPGETIHASVHYQQRLRFEEDSYEFVYPMGLTPRYDSPAHPAEGQGVHAPVARAGAPIGPVEISLTVDAGLPVGEPSSTSHPIDVVRVDQRRFQVGLAGEQIPDRDFVLRYPLAGAAPQAAGWTSRQDKDQFFLATLIPPRLDTEPRVPPREFIFVLDRSGSMSGEPIAQARNALRACLRVLNSGDTFRILLFDHLLEWYQPEPVPLTQEQLDRADAYLTRVEGRGGTEIVQALEAVLSLPTDEKRARYVAFLTDGAVSAEARALEKIRTMIKSIRLFTFGIGPSVNRAFLSRMASLGRGRAAFLQLDEDIEGAIIQFQDSVSFPVLTDLTLEWRSGKVWDIYPERLPDLYSGQAVEICGRITHLGAGPLGLTVRGRRGGAWLEMNLDLPMPSDQDAAVARVWARARVDHLLEELALEAGREHKIRDEILNLALEFDLVTPYTSFIALDHEPAVSSGQPRVIRIAQPVPQGLQPDVFTPSGPALNRMIMASAAPDMQMPAFFSRRALRKGTADRNLESIDAAEQPAVRRIADLAKESAKINDREAALRWLARMQKLDGSWDGSVEWTAAALLAFVRAGNTTRSGVFRQQMRRAAGWLLDHAGSGFAAFARVLALAELASATGDPRDLSEARQARQSLPAPSTPPEQAVWGADIPSPAAVRGLDDLRLAGVLNLTLPVPESLLQGSGGDLARTWAAAMTGR